MNTTYKLEHSQRLALLGGIEVPQEVTVAKTAIAQIFLELAHSLCEEAYKPTFNVEKICEFVDNAERNFNRVVYSHKKQDMRNARTVVEYCRTTKDQITKIPAGHPFTSDMISALLDACQMMKIIGQDCLTIPYAEITTVVNDL